MQIRRVSKEEKWKKGNRRRRKDEGTESKQGRVEEIREKGRRVVGRDRDREQEVRGRKR